VSSRSLPPLSTGVGHAEWGDNRYFGFSVGTELAGAETLTGLVALATTGRRLTPPERAVLDDIAVTMTVGDARVWPLKMTRVVSSYGGSLAAVAAANVCLEEAYVGHWTSGEAAALLSALRAEAPELTIEAMREPLDRRLRAGARLVGFGVPFRPEDERVRMLRDCLARRGRVALPHWRTLEAASGAARLLRGLEPNIGLGVAAACLDLGFSSRQISLLCVALGQTDYVANAVEGADQSPPVLRRLPDKSVEYVGKANRTSARASGE
jgi:hypothetical protein